MGHLYFQHYASSLVRPAETSPLLDDGPREFDISLLMETTLATISAVLAIKILGVSSASGPPWIIVPGVLLAAALVPTEVGRRKCPSLGFSVRHMKGSCVVLGWACVVLLPLAFCGLRLLESVGFELPLRPVPPRGKIGSTGWLIGSCMPRWLKKYFSGVICRAMS